MAHPSAVGVHHLVVPCRHDLAVNCFDGYTEGDTYASAPETMSNIEHGAVRQIWLGRATWARMVAPSGETRNGRGVDSNPVTPGATR